METTIPDHKFNQLSQFIYQQCGIQMPPAKKTMLTARIQKRLRTLGMDSFSEYIDWVLTPGAAGDELIHFIDIVTTNKTDFFRESAHFDYLVREALPDLIAREGAGVRRRLNVWSAACSSGEEPYTLAMVLAEFGESQGSFQASILATDISTRVLKKAKDAIYELEKVAPIPMTLKKKYLLKSRERPLARIGPELRQMVRFQRLNFMDADYGLRERMDVVFCRNVIIYFDRITTEQIVNKICRHLIPGGYLFIGHSESLNNLNVPVKQVAPTIYQLPK
ncbi:MAG: protein-glutamate O-methyltransferase [Magnetococcales bacterium]|nr:protein-glutamate O-methyltransferase [Magnetococcales bacterium]MBF0307981.1 protein-glutamate O-methyltransferase [Magnetococcales bacterium]